MPPTHGWLADVTRDAPGWGVPLPASQSTLHGHVAVYTITNWRDGFVKKRPVVIPTASTL